MHAIVSRVADLKPSATVEMTERVRAARAAGRRILNLSSGDPNIAPDPRVIEAANRAIRDGNTKYGPALGDDRLRQAIAQSYVRRHGVAIDFADTIVTPGGKFAVLTALMGIVEAGDEVLVPDPGWVSYGPCVHLCGGKPVTYPSLAGIDFVALENAVTPRSRAIIVNSPGNPTGRVVRGPEIAELSAFAEKHDLWIVFDQVYSDLVYDGSFASPLSVDGGKRRTFVVDSLSKSFGMTGWRIGWLVTPPGLAKPIGKFMQHSVYCVPGFLQSAAVAALDIHEEVTTQYRAQFSRRIDLTARRLSALSNVRDCRSDASFYLFPELVDDDVVVAKRWLDRLDISVLPGSAFGRSGQRHLRLAVTCADEELEEALDRILRSGF